MNIISLGLGVQSTSLYYQSSMGILPRADFAIFADLGKEKRKSYEYLEFLLNWEKQNNGIPIIIRKEKNLFHDLTNKNDQRFSSIPAFTLNPDNTIGMLRRQCTGEYKIQVVDNAIRDLYGLKPKQRRPITEVWCGITLDEMERMSIPQQSWKVNVYPYCGYKVSKKLTKAIDHDDPLNYLSGRGGLIEWYIENKLPIPPKSACVFCPYQSDASWYESMQDQEDREAILLVDNSIRNSTKQGVNNPIFLHRSCKPIDKVHLNPQDELQFGECTGVCHT